MPTLVGEGINTHTLIPFILLAMGATKTLSHLFHLDLRFLKETPLNLSKVFFFFFDSISPVLQDNTQAPFYISQKGIVCKAFYACDNVVI